WFAYHGGFVVQWGCLGFGSAFSVCGLLPVCVLADIVVYVYLAYFPYHLLVCFPFILLVFFFFQAEDGIRDATVTGVQTCALPILDLLRQKPPEADQFGAQMRELLAEVKHLSSSVHDLSHRLHPSKLDQLGLVAAIRSEERRVGKEWRSQWERKNYKTTKDNNKDTE